MRLSRPRVATRLFYHAFYKWTFVTTPRTGVCRYSSRTQRSGSVRQHGHRYLRASHIPTHRHKGSDRARKTPGDTKDRGTKDWPANGRHGNDTTAVQRTADISTPMRYKVTIELPVSLPHHDGDRLGARIMRATRDTSRALIARVTGKVVEVIGEEESIDTAKEMLQDLVTEQCLLSGRPISAIKELRSQEVAEVESSASPDPIFRSLIQLPMYSRMNEDLARDILKSESASLVRPELQLRVETGTMGERFTTAEGFIEQIHDNANAQTSGARSQKRADLVTIRGTNAAIDNAKRALQRMVDRQHQQDRNWKPQPIWEVSRIMEATALDTVGSESREPTGDTTEDIQSSTNDQPLVAPDPQGEDLKSASDKNASGVLTSRMASERELGDMSIRDPDQQLLTVSSIDFVKGSMRCGSVMPMLAYRRLQCRGVPSYRSMSTHAQQTRGSMDQEQDVPHSQGDVTHVALRPELTRSPEESAKLAEDVRTRLRLLTHPVVVITCCGKSQGEEVTKNRMVIPNPNSRGATVSSFSTVTLHPEPVVSFNLKVHSGTWAAIRRSLRFNVLFLSATPRGAAIADVFSRPHQLPHAGFTQVQEMGVYVRWTKRGQIPPYMRDINGKGIIGHMVADLLPDKTVEVGDHVVIMARVYGVRSFEECADSTSLSYSNRAYRGPDGVIEPDFGHLEMTTPTQDDGFWDGLDPLRLGEELVEEYVESEDVDEDGVHVQGKGVEEDDQLPPPPHHSIQPSLKSPSKLSARGWKVNQSGTDASSAALGKMQAASKAGFGRKAFTSFRVPVPLPPTTALPLDQLTEGKHADLSGDIIYDALCVSRQAKQQEIDGFDDDESGQGQERATRRLTGPQGVQKRGRGSKGRQRQEGYAQEAERLDFGLGTLTKHATSATVGRLASRDDDYDLSSPLPHNLGFDKFDGATIHGTMEGLKAKDDDYDDWSTPSDDYPYRDEQGASTAGSTKGGSSSGGSNVTAISEQPSRRGFSTLVRSRLMHPACPAAITQQCGISASDSSGAVLEPSARHVTVADYLSLREEPYKPRSEREEKPLYRPFPPQRPVQPLFRLRRDNQAAQERIHEIQNDPTYSPGQKARVFAELRAQILHNDRVIVKTLAINAAYQLQGMLDTGRYHSHFWALVPHLEEAIEKGQAVLLEEAKELRAMIDEPRRQSTSVGPPIRKISKEGEEPTTKEEYIKRRESIRNDYDMMKTEMMRLRQVVDEEGEGGEDDDGD